MELIIVILALPSLILEGLVKMFTNFSLTNWYVNKYRRSPDPIIALYYCLGLLMYTVIYYTIKL